MINISKSKDNEPRNLTSFRLSKNNKNDISNSTKGMYDRYSDEHSLQDLRNSLKKEQGSICCYCMCSIENGKTKIEHYCSKSKYPKLEIDYNNLYLCCDGEKTNCQDKQNENNIYNDCKCKVEKNKKIVKHCDTCKANRELNYIKLSNIEKDIEYKSDGTIYSSNEDINKELNWVLNLNINILKDNRKKAKDDLWKNLIKKLPTTWNNDFINKNIKKYKHQNKKSPYIGIILYFLNKKLKQKIKK